MIGESKRGFWSSLFDNHRYFELTIDYYAYIRGTIFTEDLKDNYGDEVPYSFDIAFLLSMLYNDFLKQIKKGELKNEDVAAYLKQGKEKYFYQKKKQRRVMKALTKHILEFSTVEDIEEEGNTSSDYKTAQITLRMREKELLRCEVLIHDLQPYLEGYKLSVEDVFVIVYMDFISSITSDGNSLKLQKTIIAHLHSAL